MTRKVKRKIHIGEEVYFWVAEKYKLDLYPYTLLYVRVHSGKKSKSILYINSNAWHFEFNPRNIKEAVEYALANDWDPNISKDMHVSKNEEGYYVLPKDYEHDFGFRSVEYSNKYNKSKK